MENEIDELKIYCGDDFFITDKIIVTHPTLRQIKDFGEAVYFNAVKTLTSVGADMKWQLYDYFNIDYTKIPDYELFIKILKPLLSCKNKLVEADNINKDVDKENKTDVYINPLQLVLKDIHLADFSEYKDEKNDQIVLYNEKEDIVIDKLIYLRIVDIVRKIHGFKRNNQLPGNERTKMDLIEDDRDEAMINANKPYKSMLRPMVSAMSVYTGRIGDDSIWDIPIGQFLDNVHRAYKIEDAKHLMQGAYSGFASLKGVDKKRLDWTGDLD